MPRINLSPRTYRARRCPPWAASKASNLRRGQERLASALLMDALYTLFRVGSRGDFSDREYQVTRAWFTRDGFGRFPLAQVCDILDLREDFVKALLKGFDELFRVDGWRPLQPSNSRIIFLQPKLKRLLAQRSGSVRQWREIFGVDPDVIARIMRARTRPVAVKFQPAAAISLLLDIDLRTFFLEYVTPARPNAPSRKRKKRLRRKLSP